MDDKEILELEWLKEEDDGFVFKGCLFGIFLSLIFFAVLGVSIWLLMR